MKRAARSLGFALSGLVHAFRHERNLKLFLLGHSIACIGFIAVLRIGALGFIILLTIIGGFFVIIELLNTAIERLADTVDDIEKKHHGGHLHLGIKITKDVAAAASLVALSIYGMFFIMMCYGVYISMTTPYFD